MQAPERLALIGGSILLSSLLIFSLKGQASQIIPKVSHSISNVYDHIGDAQKSSDFNDNYRQASSKGWKTGTWGNAKYYIDNQHNMYVGKGELQAGATLRNILGDNDTDALKTLTITQSIKAPQDSRNLFSTSNGTSVNSSSLQQINGLENVDTSDVNSMFNMFTNDTALNSINGIKDWDMSNVNDMGWMFYNTPSLKNLDISGWDDNNSSISVMFGLSGIQSLTLGPNTRVDGSSLPSGHYQNGSTVTDGNSLYTSHPGTWVHQ